MKGKENHKTADKPNNPNTYVRARRLVAIIWARIVVVNDIITCSKVYSYTCPHLEILNGKPKV